MTLTDTPDPGSDALRNIYLHIKRRMISKSVLAYASISISVVTLFSIAYMNWLISSSEARFDASAVAAGADLIRRARFVAADLLAGYRRTAEANATSNGGGINATQDPTSNGSSTHAGYGGPLSNAVTGPHMTPHAASSDKHFKTTMERLQRARQRKLRSACSAAARLPPRPRHQFIRPTFARTFNVPSLGITYCAIAKCATTTFRSFLAAVTDNPCYGRIAPASDGSRSPCARNVTRPRSFTEFEQKSVLIVRNPWSRLVSSYWNKFVVERHPLAEPCYARHGRSLLGSAPLTFAQFVDCLLEDHRRSEPLNVHLAPMHWHCSPCKVMYTYIANLETFKEDFRYLAKYVFPNTTTPEEYELALKSTKLRPNESSNQTAISYRKCYGSLSKTAINSLTELYAADAEYYGYPSRPL